MTRVRVVRGTGRGPTETAAYDAALLDAGVGNYNLVPVSSIVPADTTVEPVGTAPDLGAVGGRLTVVEASAVAPGPTSVAAGLGWTISADGPGLFYEAAGETDPAALRDRIETGLDAGRSLRDWQFDGAADRTVVTDAATDRDHVAAVVVAAFGRATPL